jgi:hypothetical protein
VSPVRYELGSYIPEDDILLVTAVKTFNLTRQNSSLPSHQDRVKAPRMDSLDSIRTREIHTLWCTRTAGLEEPREPTADPEARQTENRSYTAHSGCNSIIQLNARHQRKPPEVSSATTYHRTAEYRDLTHGRIPMTSRHREFVNGACCFCKQNSLRSSSPEALAFLRASGRRCRTHKRVPGRIYAGPCLTAHSSLTPLGAATADPALS